MSKYQCSGSWNFLLQVATEVTMAPSQAWHGSRQHQPTSYFSQDLSSLPSHSTDALCSSTDVVAHQLKTLHDQVGETWQPDPLVLNIVLQGYLESASLINLQKPYCSRAMQHCVIAQGRGKAQRYLVAVCYMHPCRSRTVVRSNVPTCSFLPLEEDTRVWNLGWTACSALFQESDSTWSLLHAFPRDAVTYYQPCPVRLFCLCTLIIFPLFRNLCFILTLLLWWNPLKTIHV